MGTLTRRRRGVYRLTVNLGFDPGTGKRRRHTETFRGNEAAARKRLLEMELGRPQPTVVPAATDDSALSVGDWLHLWLRQYVRRDRAVTTQERYTSIVDRYLVPGIGAIPLAPLTPSHIDDLEMRLVGQGLSPKTVNLFHTVLAGALRHAVRL